MREYELIVVFRADLEDEARTQLIQRVKDWIPLEGDDAAEPVISEWGRRQLAYPINKLTEGYYVMYETPMQASGISELEQNMTYVDEILRHLVVRKEG